MGLCFSDRFARMKKKGGGGVVQSLERRTPGEQVLGSILAVFAHSLLVGSVSV